MESLLSLNFCAPAYQIGLLLILTTFALLFGKARLGLLVNYVFTLYWAYIFDRDYLLEEGQKHGEYFAWLYFGFGFLIFFLALIGFLFTRE